MLVILLMLALSGVCAWLGLELRPRDRTASWVAFAFSTLFIVLLLAAVFG